MDIQRLRNLTTGRLHTEIGHVYQDIGFIIGEKSLFSHQLPSARQAMLPWLKEVIKPPRFWDDEYDKSHTGDFDLRPMDEAELKIFWDSFQTKDETIWNQLKDKTVVVQVAGK